MVSVLDRLLLALWALLVPLLLPKSALAVPAPAPQPKGHQKALPLFAVRAALCCLYRYVYRAVVLKEVELRQPLLVPDDSRQGESETARLPSPA